MKNTLRQISLQIKFPSIIALALCIILTACTTIRLVSDYDEVIDKGITDLQISAETFFTKLDHTGRKTGPLTKEEITFLDQISVSLTSLQIRAAASPKNEITIQQLELLKDSFGILSDLLQTGVTKEQVKPIRNAFNTSTTAILKLELAKKRGESANK